MTTINSIYTSLTKQNMNYIQDTTKKFGLISKQLSSDGQAGTYSDVIGLSEFLVQENNVSHFDEYIKNNKFASTRLDFMTEKVGSVLGMAQLLQQQLLLARNSTNGAILDVSTLGRDMLNQLTYFLNARYNGEYVFAGSASSNPPVVDLTTLTAIAPGQAQDFTYYQGDNDAYSIRSDDTRIVNCDINAGDAGFEGLIHSLRLCLGAPPGNLAAYSQYIGEAIDRCGDCIEQIIDVEARSATASGQISSSTKSLELLLSQAEETVKKLGYPEPTQVINDFFQTKITLALSREVLTQNLNQIKELVDSLPRR